MTTVERELIDAIVAYTRKERADVRVSEPEMVDAWQRICALCRKVRRPKVRRAAASRAEGSK